MNTLIVYDSVFGNTAQVAKSIAAALEPAGTVRLVPAQEARDLSLNDIDLLIVGSPTRGFRPTPAIDEILADLSPPDGRMVRAAAFDTRLDANEIHPAPLRWVVNAGGYAAQRIAHDLKQDGFAVAESQGDFAVQGTEGPLKPGELERAAAWARNLAA
ncbi:MAG TPA: flavodoxin domain-containing protein [Devosia sp.]